MNTKTNKTSQQNKTIPAVKSKTADQQKKKPVKTTSKVAKPQPAKPSSVVKPAGPRKVAAKNRSVPLRNGSDRSPVHDMKFPKHGSTTSSDQIQNRLKKKSPWFQSLVDPKHNADTKIPDDNGCDTGTMQCCQNIPVVINANGVAGLRITSPYPNLYNVGSALGSNYQITGPTSTALVLNWGNGTTVGNMIALRSNATLQGSTQGVRIVSACVTATPECTDLNDSGEGCAFQTPFDVDNTAANYQAVVDKFNSATLANNKKKALISRWYPTQLGMDNQGVFQAISYKDFINPSMSDEDEWIQWEFGIIYTGFPASSGSVKFEVIINYEFIPLLNTMDILSVAPSPVDPQEEQLVEAWIPSIPSGGVVSDAQVTNAPSPTKVEDNGSGFGMFFDVVKEILPIATGALALL